MSFSEISFYSFATVLVLSALGVITSRNPVHAALLLVLAFFTSAGLWLMLGAEFLAITLVLVYVGAVMVLFLFVVMMLDINVLMNRSFSVDQMPVPSPHAADYSNTKELGRLIYTEYVYAFELAAVILLVAMVAAIALTLRRRSGRKFLDPAQQVVVKRKDRIRIVSMPSEKKE